MSTLLVSVKAAHSRSPWSWIRPKVAKTTHRMSKPIISRSHCLASKVKTVIWVENLKNSKRLQFNMSSHSHSYKIRKVKLRQYLFSHNNARDQERIKIILESPKTTMLTVNRQSSMVNKHFKSLQLSQRVRLINKARNCNRCI